MTTAVGISISNGFSQLGHTTGPSRCSIVLSTSCWQYGHWAVRTCMNQYSETDGSCDSQHPCTSHTEKQTRRHASTAASSIHGSRSISTQSGRHTACDAYSIATTPSAATR
ncbi:hypothetical protein RB12234 [Rhodopirellula baltica SH 1]|uniref:Uncharacterized protein n=1 Tax=Rhodopirellula baltica (strain DSM 10527 / NCIMB 13988 / SH1) TaxID=243090 RepID=Q7UIZ3_RHOBA|nr:hypothetical protein RB12234 [Rhodopirellula baltica SH 1]